MVTQNPDELRCPYTGFKKLCKALRETCPKWVKLVGKHPQTAVPVDEWGCADTWEPILLVELAQKVNEQGAAIESFRNEMVAQGNIALALTMGGGEKPRLIGGPEKRSGIEERDQGSGIRDRPSASDA